MINDMQVAIINNFEFARNLTSLCGKQLFGDLPRELMEKRFQ
jgi:hypothetical protein